MAQTIQVLDEHGRLVGDDPGLDSEQLQEMYRLMVLARTFDRRMMALQRQGRIGTYAPLEGQEAVQIGSAMALAPHDFFFPSYREHGTELARGVPLKVMIAYWRGLPNTDWDVHRYRVGITTIPIASQLAHAVGFSYVSKLRGEGTVTLVAFGDGATSETDFHSGMNFAGVWRTPTVFLCANNGYAISVPYQRQTASETIAQKAIAYGFPGVRVDGMDPLAVFAATEEAAERARAGDGPTLIEAVTYRYGPHGTADDPHRYRGEEEEEAWRAKDPIARLAAFLRDRGELDDSIEQDIAAEMSSQVDEAIAEIEARPLPGRDEVVRHAFARIPRLVVDQLHTFQRAAGEPETPFGPDELWEVGHDEVPDGPTERYGAERVIDTPLNESGIVGTAIGMAIAGARPVAEIQFDGFVYPAFDQIVSHLGRYRYRTRGNVSVPVVVRFPNGAGIRAHEHHCDSPEAYFVHAPGLVVICPSTPIDAKGLLAAALEGDDPVIFLEPKVLYRAGREDVPTEHYTLPIGRARVRREGNDLTLVTYGGMVPVSLAAADTMAEEGVSVEVIDLRTLFPWDTDTVLSSVEKTGRLVIVQEPQASAGVAAEVAATVASAAMFSLEAPIVRVTGLDVPWPQFGIEQHALVDAAQVVAGIRQALE